MNKSNIPELFIWLIYALAGGASLVLVAFVLGNALGGSIAVGAAGAAVIALAMGGLVFGLHRLAQKKQLRDFFVGKSLTLTIVEGLIFVAMLLGMVLLRPEMSWDIVGTDAYRISQVTTDRFYVLEAHGGYRGYLYLLNFSMMLFGNRPLAAIVLQLVLLVCAAVSLYFGVRKLGGVTAALLATAFLGFAPYLVQETCELGAFLVFLFCYGIALNFIGAISDCILHTKRLPEQVLSLLCYIATGVFIGYSCYLDVAGITLLVILTFVICFDEDIRSRRDEWEIEEEETIRPGSLRAFEKRCSEFLGNQMVVFVGVIVVAFIAFRQMHDGFSTLFRQLSLYAPDSFWFYIPASFVGGLLEMIGVNALLLFGIFSFWCSRKMGRRTVWLFAVLLQAAMVCFGMISPYFDGYAFLYLLCVILAGCGIGDVYALKRVKVVRAEEKMQEETVQEESDSVTYSALENKDDMPTNDALHEIQFIENPLPLPKKHTRKVMDYDYEVADDDDFDIQ